MRKRQKGRGFRRALTEPVTRWFRLYAEAELSEEEELSWEDSALLEELSEAEATARLREWAETVLDWAHHKKFDPLMKLRGKRRRTGPGGV